MKHKSRTLIAALSFSLPLSISNVAMADVALPDKFDHIGPTVQTMTGPDGRNVAFVDTGPADGQAVLFVGGTGTSAAVIGITDYLRSLRESLGLRLVSVGRAGFGQSDPAENWTFDDYVNDAEAVLTKLAIDEVAVLAISGGGPYSAAYAARNADKIRSIHVAAALSAIGPDFHPLCGADDETMTNVMNDFAAHPLKWWAFPEDSPMHKIPGFISAAANDGARTFAIAGQKGSGDAQVAELKRYCTGTLTDVSKVEAPVYIYQGGKDSQVSTAHADRWEDAYPNIAARRDYTDEGHDIQYRHLDQILIDIAGKGDKLIVCQDGTAKILPQEEGEAAASSGATLGLCMWQK